MDLVYRYLFPISFRWIRWKRLLLMTRSTDITNFSLRQFAKIIKFKKSFPVTKAQQPKRLLEISRANFLGIVFETALGVTRKGGQYTWSRLLEASGCKPLPTSQPRNHWERPRSSYGHSLTDNDVLAVTFINFSKWIIKSELTRSKLQFETHFNLSWQLTPEINTWA